MNAESIREVIIGAIADYGSEILLILGSVLGIAVAFLVFKIGWGYLRNTPGDWGYNPHRKSWIMGRGKSVDIPTGGRIF